MRDRTYETRNERKSLIALRAQHLADADLVSVIREVRVNLDYDFKRKPIDARDDEALLTAQTVPWDTIADFEKARDDLEAWKHSQRRVLKTRNDYDAMISWAENVSARRAAGVKSGNSLGPLTAAFLRIVALGAFDVTPGTDDELGRVMTALCGIDVSRSRISTRVVEVVIRKRCASALELSRRRTKASFGACTGRDPRCFVKFYCPS